MVVGKHEKENKRNRWKRHFEKIMRALLEREGGREAVTDGRYEEFVAQGKAEITKQLGYSLESISRKKVVKKVAKNSFTPVKKAILRKNKILETRRKIRFLEDEVKYRLKNYALRFYTPYPKQDAFHRDGSRIRVILGGNRSGKTHSSLSETVAHSLGFRPWLKSSDKDYKVNVRVPNKGLIIGESFGEQVKKTIIPKLLGDVERGIPGIIPSSQLASGKPFKRNQQGIITWIKFKNGSTLDLQSYDQSVDLFESSDYDFIDYDEPPPRPIWVASQRGLTDREGRCWLAMTPLKEPWINDEIVSRSDVGKYNFDIRDNIGFGLTEAGVKQFEMTLTEDEKETRLRGRFFHLSGLVYKNYTGTNRIKRVQISRHWGLWMHIDTHPRTPHHAVWIAVLPDGKLFVCGELKNSDPVNRVGPFAEAIKVYEHTVLKRRGDEVVRLIEPGSSINNPSKDGLSIKDEIESHGFSFRPGSKNRDAGILLFQNELQYDPKAGTYPNIYFFDDLEGVHYEMMRYVWDDWAKKAAQGRTDKQRPRDKDDHFIEGIHRILLDKPYCDSREYDFDEDESPPVGVANSITGY